MRSLSHLLSDAFEARATDVHLEPDGQALVVRFRVDGVLLPGWRLDGDGAEALIADVKRLAGLDAAAHRVPREGRFRIPIAGRDMDVRVFTAPIKGERVVLALVDPARDVRDLRELGLAEDHLALVERLVHRPRGMLVVAGPGGSGKTSTLHACLRQLGPDLDHVVLMGRLRSPESVTMAAQAALRGHLVLTAMATSDGAMTLGRLVDMGLSPELVTSSVLAVLSQRLVRRLCSECRVPYSPSGHEQAELGLDSTATIFHARDGGCAACRGLGYRGRVGIFELLCMNDELRRRTMREDGALKVIAGIASVEEVVTMTTRGE